MGNIIESLVKYYWGCLPTLCIGRFVYVNEVTGFKYVLRKRLSWWSAMMVYYYREMFFFSLRYVFNFEVNKNTTGLNNNHFYLFLFVAIERFSQLNLVYILSFARCQKENMNETKWNEPSYSFLKCLPVVSLLNFAF